MRAAVTHAAPRPSPLRNVGGYSLFAVLRRGGLVQNR